MKTNDELKELREVLDALTNDEDIPKYNGGECGEDCNCMKIYVVKNGWDVKSYPCLGSKKEQIDELKRELNDE